MTRPQSRSSKDLRSAEISDRLIFIGPAVGIDGIPVCRAVSKLDGEYAAYVETTLRQILGKHKARRGVFTQALARIGGCILQLTSKITDRNIASYLVKFIEQVLATTAVQGVLCKPGPRGTAVLVPVNREYLIPFQEHDSLDNDPAVNAEGYFAYRTMPKSSAERNKTPTEEFVSDDLATATAPVPSSVLVRGSRARELWDDIVQKFHVSENPLLVDACVKLTDLEKASNETMTHMQIRGELQAYLRSVGGQSFGSDNNNAAWVELVTASLRRTSLAIECFNKECREPSYLVVKSHGAGRGYTFRAVHCVDTQAHHGGAEVVPIGLVVKILPLGTLPPKKSSRLFR